MDVEELRIKEAVRKTEVLRAPKQSLLTFGTTNIHYYLLTEPVYAEGTDSIETVVREGKVIAAKPRIVTPYYLTHLEGFSLDARRYLEALIRTYGPNVPGLFYGYRNEPKELNIVSDKLPVVVDRLNAEIERRVDPMAAIIKGEDELWDVSLLKFILDVTLGSLQDNIRELDDRGLLSMDSSGVPAEARIMIEKLFGRVVKGEAEPSDLKEELDRWGVFQEYEDRFLSVFKR